PLARARRGCAPRSSARSPAPRAAARSRPLRAARPRSGCRAPGRSGCRASRRGRRGARTPRARATPSARARAARRCRRSRRARADAARCPARSRAARAPGPRARARRSARASSGRARPRAGRPARCSSSPPQARGARRTRRAARRSSRSPRARCNRSGPGHTSVVPQHLQEQLTRYLTDAHSIEVQALAQLRTAPDIAGDPQLAEAFNRHVPETQGHERLITALLEERGAKPSRLKDTVMGIGGKGFVLFARLQPDTPGKLAAHALSYEALELASYELLARVADRAGEPEVSGAARQIAAEERAMMRRLEASFDRSTAASLEAGDGRPIGERLRKYLADAHAIEEQAIELLERAPHLTDGSLSQLYAEHLDETREH